MTGGVRQCEARLGLSVEQGHPEIAEREWFAFFASGQVPKVTVEATSAVLRDANVRPEVSAALAQAGMTPAWRRPSALSASRPKSGAGNPCCAPTASEPIDRPLHVETDAGTRAGQWPAAQATPRSSAGRGSAAEYCILDAPRGTPSTFRSHIDGYPHQCIQIARDVQRALHRRHAGLAGQVNGHWARLKQHQALLSELVKRDEPLLAAIQDQKERAKKAVELSNIRGAKLSKAVDIMSSMSKAFDAQSKAFANCDGFETTLDRFKATLKAYDTKGKDTKTKKKAAAEKSLLEAKLLLAQVKKEKVNDSYQGKGPDQWADVVKAMAKVESLKKKLAETVKGLKGDIAVVDEAK